MQSSSPTYTTYMEYRMAVYIRDTQSWHVTIACLHFCIHMFKSRTYLSSKPDENWRAETTSWSQTIENVVGGKKPKMFSRPSSILNQPEIFHGLRSNSKKHESVGNISSAASGCIWISVPVLWEECFSFTPAAPTHIKARYKATLQGCVNQEEKMGASMHLFRSRQLG